MYFLKKIFFDKFYYEDFFKTLFFDLSNIKVNLFKLKPFHLTTIDAKSISTDLKFKVIEKKLFIVTALELEKKTLISHLARFVHCFYVLVW